MSLDYRKIFKKNFGEDIQAGIPQFLIEEDYYNSLNDQIDGETQLNMRHSHDFIERFPFFELNDNMLAVPKQRQEKEVITYEDGTIKYNSEEEKYEGYVDKKLVSKCASSDRVKAFITKRFGIIDFIELKDE